MARRPPSVVRQCEVICRSHNRSVHQVDGLSRGVIAAITVVEHGPLRPGATSCALRRWRAAPDFAVRPAAWRACCLDECCSDPRAIMEAALRLLPDRARQEFWRLLQTADEAYRARTLPNPLADPDAPWWESRRPAR
jgi:hypothetical protein